MVSQEGSTVFGTRTNLENVILSSQCEFLSSQDEVNWWKRVNLAAVNHVLK